MNLKRKGMASMMDAMLFITVLGIAVSVIFAYVPAERSEISAKEIHDDLFRTELKVSDVFEIEDSRVMPLQDILAAHLISGKGNIPDHIRNVLEKRTDRHFVFTASCGNDTMNIMPGNEEKADADITSSCSAVFETPYGVLNTSFRIF